jgi:hypothetical protein
MDTYQWLSELSCWTYEDYEEDDWFSGSEPWAEEPEPGFETEFAIH